MAKGLNLSDKNLVFQAFDGFIARKQAERIFRRKFMPSRLEKEAARVSPAFRKILRTGKINKTVVRRLKKELF